MTKWRPDNDRTQINLTHFIQVENILHRKNVFFWSEQKYKIYLLLTCSIFAGTISRLSSARSFTSDIRMVDTRPIPNKIKLI